MYKIQTLNAISDIIYTQLSADTYTVAKEEPVPDGILVRSAVMHDMEFGENLLGIARAGAGVNNIPIDKCSKQGICVFNTPGANANAVAELVLCGLLLGYYLSSVSAYNALNAGYLLIFALLWLLPTVLLSDLTRRY